MPQAKAIDELVSLEELSLGETGFVNLLCGGIGAAAHDVFYPRYLAEGQPFAQVSVHLDSDPKARPQSEFRVSLTVTGKHIQALRANARRFGVEAVKIVETLLPYLDASDAGHGARTIRALSQLLYLYRLPEIRAALRDAVDSLRRHRRLRAIVPVLVSSSGGGTGSALQILLMQLLGERTELAHVLMGSAAELLRKPISIVAEPFCFVREAAPHHANRILSNSYAFRLESDEMLRRKVASYVFHVGYASATGTLLSTSRLMAQTLGNSLFELEANFDTFKARWVDGPDTAAIWHEYTGDDSPEQLHPDWFKPKRAADAAAEAANGEPQS